MSSSLMPPACQTVLDCAERDPRHAVGLAHELYADQDVPTFWREYSLGYALLAWERFDQAREHLMLALNAFEASNLPPVWRLNCQRDLLRVDLATIATTATDPWEQLITAYQELGCEREASQTAVFLVWAYREQRANTRVVDVASEWLPRLADEDCWHTAQMLRLKGAAHVDLNQVTEALLNFEQAEGCFQRIEHRIGIAHLALDHAWLAIGQQDFSQADTYLTYAENIVADHDLPLKLALVYSNRSIYFTWMGDFRHAIYFTQQSRNIFESINRIIGVGNCELDLGAIFYQSRYFGAAEGHYRIALLLHNALHSIDKVLTIYINLTQTLIENKNLLEARHFLYSYDKTAPSQHILRTAHQYMLANLLHKQQKTTESLALFAETARSFSEHGDQARSAQAWLEYGWIKLEQQQDLAEVERVLLAIVPTFRERPMYAWRALYGLARCRSLQHDQAAALAYCRQASEQISRMRQAVMSEVLSSSIVRQAVAMYELGLQLAHELGSADDFAHLVEEYRALAFKRLLTTPPPLPTNDQSNLLSEISTLNDQVAQHRDNVTIHEQLRHALDRYSDWVIQHRHQQPLSDLVLAPLNLAQIQAQLQERYATNWTILTYFWHDRTILLLEVTADACVTHAMHLEGYQRDLLRSACDESGQGFTFLPNPNIPDQWEHVHRLMPLVFPQHIHVRLHHDHRLYIVPSGDLQRFPWALARVNQHWLYQQAIVQLIPSLGLLQGGAPPARERMLVCGSETFDGRYPDLPSNHAELSAIADVYAARSVIRHDHLTVADFRHLLTERYDVIHLSTHAEVYSDRALVAAIAFEDADLWLDDVLRLQTHDAQLVLSTCDGAIGEVLAGDETLSLTWALMVAGARGVVASVWRTPAYAILDLVRPLHTYYLQSGDMAYALAYAMRDQTISHLEWGGFLYTSRWV